MYVVLPDSEVPLGFAEEIFPPVTTYPCLNNLNATWGYTDIYPPFGGGTNNPLFLVIFPDSVDMDTIVAAYLASGCVENAYRVSLAYQHGVPSATYASEGPRQILKMHQV